MNGAEHDDVERIFRHLVTALKAKDPERVKAPLEIAEIYQSILPYRQYRSALNFDSNEDYEMAILRFLSGEGGFVSLDPVEAQEAILEEVQEINPNPGAFRDYAAAKVFLNTRAVESLDDEHDAYAPPSVDDASDDRSVEPTRDERNEIDEDVAQDEPPGPDANDAWRDAVFGPEPDAAPSPDAVTLPFMPDLVASEHLSPPPGLVTGAPVSDEAPTSCRACGRRLPEGRIVHFCPYCGVGTSVRQCPHCDTRIEHDWTYCIACGRSVRDG